ncbi:MAG: VWA domain-containing protein [Vicingaceae bacterium]
MRIILFFLLSYSALSGFSQIQLSQTVFDLGEISLLNSDIVDFEAQNISNKTIFLLRIEAEQSVGFQYTSKTIRPGTKEGIRIKLNPDSKGKVERKAQFFFSNNPNPIEIILRAVVKALPKNNRTACPQFGTTLKAPTGRPQPVAKIQKFDLILFDTESENQLAIVESNLETQAKKTVAVTTPTSTPKSYGPTTRPNRTARPVRFKKVRKSPEERRNSPSLGTTLFGQKVDSTAVTEEPEQKEKLIQKLKPVQKTKEAIVMGVEAEPIAEKILIEKVQNPKVSSKQETIQPSSQVEEIEENQTLLDESFKPNNIVFLIDASTSMREEQKMDLLKTAMIQLLEPLREIDFITIVTYSGEAKVVLPTSSGNLKDEIAVQIENLTADGSTNAVKGIKKAIQVGKSNFLENGNNQIFLASDGDFNIGENNMSLRKKIVKTAEEGLTITVLGIKNDNWTNKSLKEIADLGEGDLLKIKSMRDASKVLQSMKRKAKL